MQGKIFDGHVRRKRIDPDVLNKSALSRPTRYGLSAHRRYSENREEPATFDNPPERRERRRWCFLEDLVAFRERAPRLLAARPNVPGRPEPRCIVERTRPDSDHPIQRRAGDPRAAFRANPSDARSAAIGEALKGTRFKPTEFKRRLRYHDTD